MEIERKFLVEIGAVPPDALASPSTPIAQRYALPGDVPVGVRIRRKGDAWFLTFKGPGGLSREEVEFPVGASEGAALWSLFAGGQVEKERFAYPCGEHLFEIDVFRGDLAGLVLVEVEFDSEEEARSFQAPDWFGAEVTDDPRYFNATLSEKGLPGGAP